MDMSKMCLRYGKSSGDAGLSRSQVVLQALEIAKSTARPSGDQRRLPGLLHIKAAGLRRAAAAGGHGS